MSGDEKEDMVKIHDDMVMKILEFLKTGELNVTGNAYITAYHVIYEWAEDDILKEKLHKYYQNTMKNYIKEAINHIMKKTDNELIDIYIEENRKLVLFIYWMKKIFKYIDGVEIKEEESLFQISHNIYKEEFFPIKLQKHIFNAINSMITDDREENQIDRTKIKRCLQVLEDLDIITPQVEVINSEFAWTGEKNLTVYKQWFKTFEKCTAHFVKNKGLTEISNFSALEYIRSNQKYLNYENERKNFYIHKSHHSDIDQINYKYLIVDHLGTLLRMGSGIKFMIDHRQDNELKEAYRFIVSHNDSLKLMAMELEPYIKKKGETLFKDESLKKNPKTFIQELIRLKKDIDKLVKDCFNSNISFEDSKNRAFTFFMNKDFYPIKLAEFCDLEFRFGFKNIGDDKINDSLNDIINIFKCINNRLKFQLEYTIKLTDRLLSNASISIIAEKNFIAKLKIEAGVTYVTKMSSMIQDLESSKKEMESFRRLTHKGRPGGIELNVQILNNCWDIDQNKLEKILTPSSFKFCMDDFAGYYLRDRNMYKLDYVQGLGTVVYQIIDDSFFVKKKNIEPTSSYIQFLIVTTLEKYERLKISKIAEIMMHPHVEYIAFEANYLIYHPVFNKTKDPKAGLILSNAPEKKDLNPDNEIWLNKDFNPNNNKPNTVPILNRFKAQTGESSKIDYELVSRKCILDATITRIMKGKIGKITTYTKLISEVTTQISLFTPQPPFIKERIEYLIEKDILKRKHEDYNCFEYVA